MRKNTFGGDALPNQRLQALLHKFTMRIARLEPQKLPFFTEFFNRHCRHPSLATGGPPVESIKSGMRVGQPVATIGFPPLDVRKISSNPARRAAPLRGFSAAFPAVPAGELAGEEAFSLYRPA